MPTKRGPKRKSCQVQGLEEVFAIYEARRQGFSWGQISKRFGLLHLNGTTAKNICLRAERVVRRLAS